MDPLKELKGLDAGRLLALVKKLGGREVVNAILRGKKIVTVEDAIWLLFDKHSRRIPEGLRAKVCDAERDFRLDRPKLEMEIDYAIRILRLHECLNIDTEVTAQQLKAEAERLLAIIRGNSRIANIANGVCLPVVLPRLVTADLGSEMELYLAGVAKSYPKTFGDRKFYNYREGTLANEVSVVDGSRHDQLISRMKEGPVIGLHFPNPLQGFSIHASREQMLALPERFILSGIDTLIAMVMYPDILARDWNALGLDLAGLQWQCSDFSLHFEVYNDELAFDYVEYLADTNVCYSSGLLFLG